MLRRAAALAGKDLKLCVAGGQGLVQAVLLGLLLIFLFSLSRPAGQLVPAQAAGAVFWLASAFGLVLVFNDLFSLEETNGQRLGLLTSPVPAHAVWLGKGAAGLGLLFVSQVVFLPATAVFLGQDINGPVWVLLAALALADIGLAALGALLGALSQGSAARESLLSVILFPLLLPVLLGGIKCFSLAFAGDGPGQEIVEPGTWLGIIGAFDALFGGAGLILFPFVYTGEE